MKPTSKYERRIQMDQIAASRYAARRKADQKLEELKLARRLREVWQ